MRRVLGALAVTVAVLTAGASSLPAGAATPEHSSDRSPGQSFTPVAKATALATAQEYLARAGRSSGDDRFVQVSTSTGVAGAQYVGYRRTYHGLPVIGGDVVVAMDRTGQLVGDPLASEAPLSLSLKATVSASRAQQLARRQVPGATSVGSAVLSVFSPRGQQRLAYEIVVHGGSAVRPSTMHIVIDARTSAVLGRWDEVLDGTGKGYYYRDVHLDTTASNGKYSMTDPNVPGLFCGISGNGAPTGSDDVWGNGSGTDMETACADTLFVAQKEFAMLRTWLGRNGWDGTGKGYPVFVGNPAVNAYWNGHTVNIGRTKDNKRQLTTLDIVGHEFGHAIFQFTPGGFDGDVETYQLNEANGDIFGTLTEHFANDPGDPPDYVYAEAADAFNRGPERIMYDPSAGPRDEPNCWSPELKTKEVHDGAGPANHFFYLMAEGSNPGGGKPASPICAGGPASVRGVGIQKAGKIWMETLQLKTSFWTYADARNAAMRAVSLALPGDCPAFDAVKGAWDGISVPAKAGEPTRPSTCGSTPTPTPTPTATSTPTPTPTSTGSCLAESTQSLAIKDFASVDSPVTISGCSSTTSDLSVTVDITHTYIGDLTVSLVGPDGTVYPLHSRTGNGTKDIKKTYTVRRSGSTLNGTWKLRVSDQGPGDTGTLNNWKLSLG